MTRSGRGDAKPQSTSEKMKKLASLALNVRLCAGRLFPETARPVDDLSLEEAPAAKPSAPSQAPVIAEAAPAPAAPEPATAPNKPDRPPAATPGAKDRVVVVAAAAEKVDDKISDGLADQIARELAGMHPSDIIPAADVKGVLKQRQDTARECLDRQYCPAAVASKLDATLLVTATLDGTKGAYVLTMTSGQPLQAQRQTASEKMRQLSNLGLNIRPGAAAPPSVP
jgi:hypothetical protein